jgi:hypothetical protein
LDKDNWFPFLKYCHENKAWVGEEWDPERSEFDAGMAELVQQENDKKNDKERDDPVEATEEGFAFISREE